jgi:hypothetical protein
MSVANSRFVAEILQISKSCHACADRYDIEMRNNVKDGSFALT